MIECSPDKFVYIVINFFNFCLKIPHHGDILFTSDIYTLTYRAVRYTSVAVYWIDFTCTFIRVYSILSWILWLPLFIVTVSFLVVFELFSCQTTSIKCWFVFHFCQIIGSDLISKKLHVPLEELL